MVKSTTSAEMSGTLSLALSAVALYAARKSYIAITSLRKYEEHSERAAKHSETAAHELYKTRATQASSAAAVCILSFLPLSMPYYRFYITDIVINIHIDCA